VFHGKVLGIGGAGKNDPVKSSPQKLP